MNHESKVITLLALMAIALFATACAPQVAQAESAGANPVAATYQDVLGMSLNNKSVADFVARNNCANSGTFELCKNAGMALWLDADRVVKTVYLYPAGTNGFTPYQGELPFNLSADDTMAAVEQKLGQPKVEFAPQAGWQPGLPDEGTTPDHAHYWAIYKRFGITIVYSSPFADDKNATVYGILVNK